MKPENVSRREVLALLAAMGIGAGEVGSAFAQSTKHEEGAGGKVVFENDKVRVLSHLGRPRMGVCGTGLHSHPPHLTIALTDVKAKVSLQGKEPFVDEQKAGATFWDPGGPHVVENMGRRDSKVYLVELKG
ncbi:MAG: hypothetical protein ABIO63_06135 [Casimicrobiaceae bacterium]